MIVSKDKGEPTMENKEINYFDLDDDWDSYYEVELWESGDCDSHFFAHKRDAIRFFDKNKKHPSDCVKRHYGEGLGGDTELVKENH